MIISEPEKYEFADKDIIPEPVTDKKRKGKRRISRRAKTWLRVGVSAAILLTLRSFFTARRELEHEFRSLVQDDGRSHEHRFSVIDTILNGQKAEELFLSIPNSKSALSTSRAYATHPHLAGSPEDLDDAKVILELFQTHFGVPVSKVDPIFPAGSPESRNATLGIAELSSPQAWIDVYYPIMNTPLDRSLEILDEDGKPAWSADLVEDGDILDPEAAKYKDAVPTWHGFSRGGEVQGQLVYANYGNREDYEDLVASGVDLKGKIVIARYGDIFRGLKIKGAQELGAVGVLLYSDPRDDGSVTVENGYKAYPEGPARNPTSVERGSVQFISAYPGDPTTPGYPAYENSTRTEGTNIPSIPSLPISWSNAQRLLEEIGASPDSRLLSGKVSKRSIKLVNHVDNKVTPIWNTMAVIPGHIKNEVVVIGNHRDAWVMGAADPTSGTVSIHEIVRGFGALLRSGWKPLRTTVFASWDAEEYGLVGSTEWGEDFPEWISDHVVAYLNVDVAVAGSTWFALSSPSLAHLIRRTAMDVAHPTEAGKSLWDARNDQGPFGGRSDPDFLASYEALQNKSRASDTGVGLLGSGSDFTVFLQRLGIASSDQSFASTPSDAVYHYHSIYDSQHFQEVYADSGFHRHVAIAKQLGLVALRIIDSIILPLNTTQYSLELDNYLDSVEEIASAMSVKPDLTPLRKSIKALQSASAALDEEKMEAEAKFKELLDQIPADQKPCPPRGAWGRVRDWIKRFFGVRHDHRHHGHGHGHRPEPPVSEWFRPDEHSNDARSKTHRSKSSHAKGQSDDRSPAHTFGFPIRKFIRAAKRVSRANKKLTAFERGFISEEGIKDREWYKHLGVAPGKWLGYGATTFPALTEALTIEKNVTLADQEVIRLQTLIDKLAARLAV